MGALMEAEWNARSTARMLCASGCVGGEQQCAACRSLDLIMLEDSCLAQGKVRDTYVVGDKVVLVTTDRQSAFDRLLASIPFKARTCLLSMLASMPPTGNTCICHCSHFKGSEQFCRPCRSIAEQ